LRPTPIIEAEQEAISRIFLDLGSSRSGEAWAEFLETYAPLLFRVARLCETDEDDAADCFLFICEQLSQRRCRRLRQFRPEGPARFSTWLRVVARRLWLDWRRRQFGRPRLFRSISRLPDLDRQVFRCAREKGLSAEETFRRLLTAFPALTVEQVKDTLERIEQSLTPRQWRLLDARPPVVESLEEERIADPAPDPEALAERRQQREAVLRVVARLPAEDRLVVRLRFEQELTLAQMARILGLRDAQSADRRIRVILDRLRRQLDVAHGKTRAASV